MTALVYANTPIRQQHDMLSLTDMWKAAGSPPTQRPADWKNDTANLAFLDHVALISNAAPDGIWLGQRGNGGSTFAHWQIGLAYAKWLSPEFHAWCNSVVRERMEGRAAAARHGIVAQNAATAFEAYLSVGRLIGLDQNQAAISAGRAAKVAVGENPLDTMGVTHLLAPQQDSLLTVTDIGKRLGGRSAIVVNQLLQERGLQLGLRDGKDRPYWEPTEAGRAHAVFLDTGKKHSDGTPVRQLKWAASVLDALARAAS